MKKSIFFLILILTLLIEYSFAQWNINPTINTPVVLASKSQQDIHAITDTKGGSILAWVDNRNTLTGSADIYAQRLKSNGYVKWTTNGVAICTDTLTQKAVAITEGGVDGSAIITWQDKRSGNHDIYAQKIDSSGNVLWTTNGIAVCNKVTEQINPGIISDNAGGAIIVWEDSINFYWDIYAQHISTTGALLWPSSGVPICASPNTQTNPRIDADGTGGAIIVWQDKRGNIDYDIYAQRINLAGVVQWTTNGVVVCATAGTQSNPRIEPDGLNGALIGWLDKRAGADYNIYAQRLNSSGIAQWASNGVAVCNASGNQSALDIKYLGSNGLSLTWKDERSGPTMIYTQFLNLSGIVQLAANGLQLSTGLQSINPNSISDGNGGVIIAWQDSVANTNWDIKGQKLNASGVEQWTLGGATICNAADGQRNVTQTTDGSGGAIFAWEDHRSFDNYEIYAHHVPSAGTPQVGINELSKANSLQVNCFPNPTSSNVSIRLNNNSLNKDWDIFVYDAYGNNICSRSLKSEEAYEFSGEENVAGTYFYFITLKDKSASSKGTFISVK